MASSIPVFIDPANLAAGEVIISSTSSAAASHNLALVAQAPVSVLPMVTTTTQNTVNATSAVLGGNVTAEGGVSVTDRGVVWATTTTPTVANNKVTNGIGLGTFTGVVSGLPPNTLVYVRAYAK